MPAPDLSAAVSTMTGLMVDGNGDPIIAVRIDRDPSAETDDAFDPETLTWSRPTGDVTEVYSGKALVKVEDRATFGAVDETGYQQEVVSIWRIRLPLSAPAMRPGDLVTVTVSQRNPGLVGRWAVVQEVPASGFSVAQKATALERVSVAFGRSDQA